MRKKYELLIKELPLEACSDELVLAVLQKSGIKNRGYQQARIYSHPRNGWMYRAAALLMIIFLTGTAVFDLNKTEPVDKAQWSVNSNNLVYLFKQNANLLLNEGCVKK